MQAEETRAEIAARLEALLAAAEALLAKPKWQKFSTLMRRIKDAPMRSQDCSSFVQQQKQEVLALLKGQNSQLKLAFKELMSLEFPQILRIEPVDAVAKLELNEHVADAAHAAPEADAQPTLADYTDTDTEPMYAVKEEPSATQPDDNNCNNNVEAPRRPQRTAAVLARFVMSELGGSDDSWTILQSSATSSYAHNTEVLAHII
jgi:hypothetical protein